MAHYRNKYLNFVKNNFQNYDYMMVMDMDMAGTMPIHGFIDNFKIKEEWDAILSNGLSGFSFPSLGIKHITYDEIAFEPYKKKYKYGIKNVEINKLQRKEVKKALKEKKFLRVNSAFNGAGLYRISSILKHNPSYHSNLGCEHRGLHKNFKKVFINPAWNVYMGAQGPDSIKFLFKGVNYYWDNRKVL